MTKRIKWWHEFRKPSQLKPYTKNPRIITEAGLDQLKESFDEIGMAQPININLDNVILSGHARVQQLIREGKGDESIDVMVPSRVLTDKEEEAVIIRMNKNVAGEWDIEKLNSEDWNRDELLDWGFTEEELGVPEVEVLPSENDDVVPEVKHDPVTKRGDVWLLGEHRVMCGDSTMIDDVEKLMKGEKADMVFTDPPYGMNLNTDYSKMGSDTIKPGKKHGNIINDEKSFDPSFIFSEFFYCKDIVLFGADYYAEKLQDKNDGSWLIWDKRVEDRYDKIIGSVFETIWSKRKVKREIIRHEYVSWKSRMEDNVDGGKPHPTMKPVSLLLKLFNKFKTNSMVDLFLGSGSTLIACEKTNRKCYGMELDEHYCDVIVKRWQDFTDKEAVLESTGEKYNQLLDKRS